MMQYLSNSLSRAGAPTGMRRLLLVLAAVLACMCPARAQLENNYIFLFDCTQSMRDGHLWEPAKTALGNTITSLTDIENAHFTVIPFTDTIFQAIDFDSGTYVGKLKNIDETFHDATYHPHRYTYISDALEAGFASVNPNKKNRIYLFTDGRPEGGDTPQRVAETILRWCASHRNTRLFYVALTGGVVTPEIIRAGEQCPDMFIVQCDNGIIEQIVDISSDVYTNIEELAVPREIDFSLPGEHPVRIASADSLFDIRIVGDKATGGKIALTVAPRAGLSTDELHRLLQGCDHTFTATVSSAVKGYRVANPELRVHVSDHVQSQLTVAGGVDQLRADGARWHDSFLWSDSRPDERVAWELAPQFAHALPGASMTLRVRPADGADDYRVWYNGTELGADSLIVLREGTPARLEIQFDHDAATGKRYFDLTPVESSGVDIVNGTPADQYAGTSLRTSYTVGWNPLATVLTWLGIALLAAIVLWLCVIKRMVYPTFKRGVIVIQSPYYASLRVRGARKLVFTPRRRSQGWLDRIARGRIIYHVNTIWPCEVEVTPASKSMRFSCLSHRLVSDPLPLWQAGGTYKILDSQTGKNIVQLTIN